LSSAKPICVEQSLATTPLAGPSSSMRRGDASPAASLSKDRRGTCARRVTPYLSGCCMTRFCALHAYADRRAAVVVLDKMMRRVQDEHTETRSQPLSVSSCIHCGKFHIGYEPKASARQCRQRKKAAADATVQTADQGQTPVSHRGTEPGR
jgi:hypothetical protein